MKRRPIVFRFCSGSVTPASSLRNVVLRLDMDERDVERAAEELDDVLRLIETHQTVIDEDAGELIADRLMDEDGGDGGIDAAGKAADHPPLADLLADLRDRAILEGGHGPVTGKARNAVDEIGEEPRAIRRMGDFGVELNAVEFPALIGDGGEGRALRGADDGEARRQRR